MILWPSFPALFPREDPRLQILGDPGNQGGSEARRAHRGRIPEVLPENRDRATQRLQVNWIEILFITSNIRNARQSRSQLDRPDRILIGRHLSLEDTFCVCRALFYRSFRRFVFPLSFYSQPLFLWINHSRRSFVSSVFAATSKCWYRTPGNMAWNMNAARFGITTIIYPVAYFTNRIKITSVQ